MRFGLVEISWTFIFQILNTLALLAIIIGIPYYIIKKFKSIENRLKKIEGMLVNQKSVDQED